MAAARFAYAHFDRHRAAGAGDGGAPAQRRWFGAARHQIPQVGRHQRLLLGREERGQRALLDLGRGHAEQPCGRRVRAAHAAVHVGENAARRSELEEVDDVLLASRLALLLRLERAPQRIQSFDSQVQRARRARVRDAGTQRFLQQLPHRRYAHRETVVLPGDHAGW